MFPDQHRGDWLPFSGGSSPVPRAQHPPVRMQNLRELMDRGTTFTRAITNSPLCAPARACLASGQAYEACGVWNNNFCCPLTQPTCYGVLQSGGYQVGGVGKFDLHKPVMFWGREGWLPQLGDLGFTKALDHEGKWDAFWASYAPPRGPYGEFLHSRGFLEQYWRDYVRRYYDQLDTSPTALPQDAYADDWETENALSMLRDFAQKDAPWFFMVSFSGPHDPWDVTASMRQRWNGVDFPIPESYHGDRKKLLAVRQNYAAMLENIDRNIGRLISWLKASGQYENTVVIYASDHGEMLGDRDLYYKSVPYEASVRIPLVISGAGIRQGAECDALVQLNDLAATITELAGLSMPGGVDSRSLLPLVSKKDAPHIRSFQNAALYTSYPRTGGCVGYEAYAPYIKDMGGAELINQFNDRLGLPQCEAPAAKNAKKRDWRCVITKRHKLIEYLNPQELELYDLEADPQEQVNLAAAQPEILAQMRTQLPPTPPMAKEATPCEANPAGIS